MTTTLSNLITRTRRWLHETVASESFFSDTFITNVINAAYRRRCGRLIMAYEGSFTQTALRDLVENQSLYSWPQGLIRLQRLDYVSADGIETPIPRYGRLFEALNPTSVQPYSFRPVENGFKLEPTPTTTITNGLKIEYIATPAELTAMGDNTHADFPDIFTELIVLDAVCYLLDSEANMEDGVPRAALRARAEYEADFDRFIDNKMIKTQSIIPQVLHYIDS